MPVLTYDTLDAVPEGLREVAKPDEATGKLKVSVVPAAKIDEFRDNNIKLSQERDELVSRVNRYQQVVGDDVDAFQLDLEDARSTRQRVKDGELKESRAVLEEVDKRTQEMRKSYEEQVQSKGKEGAAWKTKAEQLDTQLRQQYVVNAIKDAATTSDLGVESKAIADITQRALAVFRADENGRVTPYSGEAPIYGADGVTPMSPQEWLVKLREDAPYFFKGSNGGGAQGSGDKKIHGGGRYSTAELAKMGPRERLAALNGEPAARL